MHVSDAFALLGLTDKATAADIRTAFRHHAMAAHRHGDGQDRLRQLIAAREILTNSVNSLPQDIVISYETKILALTPLQALHGGELTLAVPMPLELIDDRQSGQSLMHQQNLTLSLPAGLRHGETAQLLAAQTGLARHSFTIEIPPQDTLSVSGDDLWMNHRLDPSALRFGGLIDIDTPHGPQSVPILRGTPSGACLCLKHKGLPATDTRPQGHLYIRLEAVAAPMRPASDLLSDFQKRWA
ncbi:MAG: DnaJ C-terminal domain-containing protein [Asticcacaulis sp.]